MDQVSTLEEESLYIIREAYHKIENLGMLWSIGKDSTVLMWLTRKAFFGHVPFPVIHIDTSFKIPEMIAYRDRMAEEWDFNLIVGQNTEALKEGMDYTKGRLNCCSALKTAALKQVIAQHQIDGILLGIRHDEEGSRSKERIFSSRNQAFEWDIKDQPPEFWDTYRTDFPPGDHVRVHPLLKWSELDIWPYIERHNIPLIDLYFANADGKRYRSLGCAPCTSPIQSHARSVREIIEELETIKSSERAGRAQDQEDLHAMEKLRLAGYM